MWWIPLAMGAVSMLNEKRKEDNLNRYNKAQSEITRYSPWTGMRGQIQADTGPGLLGAGLGGAIGGLGVMQSFNKANPQSAAANVSGSSSLSMPTVGQSVAPATPSYNVGANYTFNQPDFMKANGYGTNPYMMMAYNR